MERITSDTRADVDVLGELLESLSGDSEDTAPSIPARAESPEGRPLPSPEAVAPFQGAWEATETHMPQGQHIEVWLQAFVITGRLAFSCDGSECYLQRMGPGAGAVCLEGGELSLEDGGQVLVRTGKSGNVLRFRRFLLPPTVMAERIEGLWETSVDGPEPPGDPEWDRVVIHGYRWMLRTSCGFLRMSEANGKLMLGERTLTLPSFAANGRKCLWLEHRSGLRLHCHYVRSFGNPWE